MPKKMSKAKKIYIDYGSDSYKEGLSDGKEQGRKEERELNLSRINNIWSWFQFNESPECVDIRRDIFEFKEYLEQELKKLKEVKNG